MSTSPRQNSIDVGFLAAAQRGDSQKFSELAEPFRRELQVHCYRILGSLHEAEDMVQETMVKAWKNIGTFEGRASFRSWLYRIATNCCLDFLDQKRTQRLLPVNFRPASDPQMKILPPLADSTWLEPFPDEWLEDAHAINPEARYTEFESISLSFLMVLQALPPRQRAVLILRDVLDFSAEETAGILESTLSSVNSSLHRARKTLTARYQGGMPDEPDAVILDEKTKGLLDHFVQAWESADVAGLVKLLKEDAIFEMPPSPSWYQGRNEIAQLLSMMPFGNNEMFPGPAETRWRLLRTRANASIAFAMYQRNEKQRYQAFGMLLVEQDGARISRITNFIDPLLPMRFGLPSQLA